MTKFPAYRQAGKLQINSNIPITNWNLDIGDYLIIGAWLLVIVHTTLSHFGTFESMGMLLAQRSNP